MNPKFNVSDWFEFGVILKYADCEFPELSNNLSSDLLLCVFRGGVLNLSSFCYGVLLTTCAFYTSFFMLSLGVDGDFISLVFGEDLLLLTFSVFGDYNFYSIFF